MTLLLTRDPSPTLTAPRRESPKPRLSRCSPLHPPLWEMHAHTHRCRYTHIRAHMNIEWTCMYALGQGGEGMSKREGEE